MRGKVNFMCLGENCPNHCCGPHKGIQENLISLYGKRFMDLPVVEDKRDDIEEKGEGDKIYHDEGLGISFIDLNKDKSCPFFEEKSCSVGVFGEDLLDIKDTGVPVCAAYPFYVDPFLGLCADASCPV